MGQNPLFRSKLSILRQPPSLYEPVQDLDYGMQDKAKVGEKAQHTGVLEHFELTYNAVMHPLARFRIGSNVIKHNMKMLTVMAYAGFTESIDQNCAEIFLSKAISTGASPFQATIEIALVRRIKASKVGLLIS